MRALSILLGTTLLVATVSSQPTTLPPRPMPTEGERFEPFQNPGEIIPNTGLTIQYLISAAGGIWQQNRAIDSAAYVCTDILPFIASVVPKVENSSLSWGPYCDDVIEASNDLDSFDATGWCNGLIDMFLNPPTLGNGGRNRRQSPESSMVYPGSMELPFNIVEILVNITRDLYGIDINMIINDISTINTICTNVKEHFLMPSLQDIVTKFGAELIGVLLPQARPICQDFDGFLQNFMINSSSPSYTIIQDIRELVAQAVGFSSADLLCQNITATLADGSFEARRSSSTAWIRSLFGILKNAERCSMLANGLIDDVIEPLVNLDTPSNMAFAITDEVIYKNTGFQGPDALDKMCRFVENNFTSNLFTSTVIMTVTVQTIDGEQVQFTDDLKDRESAAFKRLERISCGGVVSLIEREQGSDVRKVGCEVTSFSPGSIIVALEVDIYATTQANANGIAQSVTELSVDVLSSDGVSLGVSELTSTVDGSAGTVRSLSIGAIIFIAMGVVTSGLW